MEFTCSQADLRKCYGRAMLCSLLIVVFTGVFGLALGKLYTWAVEPLTLSEGERLCALLLLNEVISYVPPLIVIPLVLRRMPKAEKPEVRALPLRELAIAVPFCIGALYLFALLTNGLISALEALTGAETSNALELMADVPLGLYALCTVVVAPVCEEFLFRRLFLNRCRALGELSAILLSSAAFALMHENLYQLLYAFVAGVCLGSVAILTGRIRECIFLHMCVNGVNILGGLELGDLWVSCVGLFILACIGFALYVCYQRRGRYRFDPGPLPYTPEEKRHACLSSPCFWICGGLALAWSVAAIFLI